MADMAGKRRLVSERWQFFMGFRATAQVEMLVGADSFLRDLEDSDTQQFVHFVQTWNDSIELESDCESYQDEFLVRVGTSPPLEQIPYNLCVCVKIRMHNLKKYRCRNQSLLQNLVLITIPIIILIYTRHNRHKIVIIIIIILKNDAE